MFDEINPKYNISEKIKKYILDIERELENIEINDNKRVEYLKLKSKVRSIHSSLAIEANSLSLKNVADIANNKMIIGKKDEVQEVKNAIELYNNINKYDWKSEKDFLEAHALLMKYFDDDNGYYRNHGEGVQKGDEVIFTAPESILVPMLMKSLFSFIKNSKDHPLIISSIFHYYLVYIHPFSDGNGRIARFWVSLILKDYNNVFEFIPFEEEIYLKQDDYYQAISKCHNNGNANEFIDFMLKIILECIRKTTQKTTQIKLNDNQIKILKLIKEHPSITRKELAQKLKITSDGVKYNIKILKDNGIIERVGADNGGYWQVNDENDGYKS